MFLFCPIFYSTRIYPKHPGFKIPIQLQGKHAYAIMFETFILPMGIFEPHAAISCSRCPCALYITFIFFRECLSNMPHSAARDAKAALLSVFRYLAGVYGVIIQVNLDISNGERCRKDLLTSRHSGK